MALRLSMVFIILALLSVADCRVKFTHSSIYDEFDFTGQTKVELEECTGANKCAIFVSILIETKYEDVYGNLQMAMEFRQSNFSLLQFAGMRDVATRQIEPYYILDSADEPTTKYYIWNDNKELVAAPLVIYVVNLDKEPNYDHTTGVFDAADIGDGVVRGGIITILSAKPFTTAISGDKDTIATIFATGFDNADVNDNNPDKCRRVLQTNFDQMVSFQINGPITSIYFSDFKGNLINSKNIINTALTFAYKNLAIEPRGFVTSQGFIGCKSGQNYRSSLYGNLVQYSLFTPDAHFVHQEIYLNTDDGRPLNVQTDKGLTNYLGTDLLTSQPDCILTHKLEVNFNESQTNSFSFGFSFSNTNCDDEVQTTSGKSTTTITVGPTTSSSVGFGTLSLLTMVAHRILVH